MYNIPPVIQQSPNACCSSAVYSPAPCSLCSRRCNAGLRQVSRLTGLRLKLLHITNAMTSLDFQIAASSWGILSRNRGK